MYLITGLAGVLLSEAAGAAPLSDAALERQTQTAQLQDRTRGVRRFVYMRHYKPTDQFVRSSADQDTRYEQALAMYLVNMYVSTRLYGNEAAKELTLNYIGVLDGFEQQGAGFDFVHARRFYQQHQESLEQLLKQRLQEGAYPWESPSEQEIDRWLLLLQSAPKQDGQIAFSFPVPNKLNVLLPSQVHERFAPLVEQANIQARKQVITYDMPDLQLEDFDSHIGNHTYRRKRTYRWVKDECNYSSYLLAKQVTRALVEDATQWEHTHLYLITATPRRGEFLIPAQGARFKLADGSDGLHWRYHTAVLVMLQQEGRYFPVILDSFLAGDQPVSLAEWLTQFNVKTVFRAQPFVRNKTVEAALKVPSRLEENAVWVEGQKYLPAEVLR